MTKLTVPLRHYVPNDESGAISPGKLSLLLLAALALAVSIPLFLSRHSESAPAADPIHSAPSDVDAKLAPIRNMARWADKLDAMRAAGLQNALRIEERGSETAPGSPDMSELVREWHLWSKDWLTELDGAGSPFVDGLDSASDKNLRLAHQRLTEALEQLRHVPETPNKETLPRKLMVESFFRIAENHIQVARTYLSRVRQ